MIETRDVVSYVTSFAVFGTLLTAFLHDLIVCFSLMSSVTSLFHPKEHTFIPYLLPGVFVEYENTRQ